MNLRRFSAVFLLCSLCLCLFSGCSLLEDLGKSSSYDPDNLRFYTKEDQEKHALEIKNEIIRCFVNGDKNGLRDMFSEVALERAEGIDGDINDLFNSFEIVEAVDDKCSVSMFGENGPDAWAYLTCSCSVKTSKGNVILQWKEVALKKHDRSYEGLYSLMLNEFYQDMPYYAGIVRSEQKGLLWINEFEGAHDHSIKDYEAYAEDHMTEDYAKGLTVEELEALGHILHIHARDYLTWNVKRGDIQYVFIEKYSNHHYFVICFGVSEKEPDLICHASALEYEEGDVPSSDDVINAGLDFLVDFQSGLIQG